MALANTLCLSTQSLTVTFTDCDPTQLPLVKLYVSVCVPTPADAALNVEPDTPLPLHVPPSGVALNCTSVSERHTCVGALVIAMLAVTPANTVIVNVLDAPGQVLAVGVTVIVATCVTPLVLVTTNGAMLPVPAAARPMLVLLFVQL